MKATVNRADLAGAARWVSAAIPRSPSVPILAGMLVSAIESRTGPHGAGVVVVEGFDFDTALRVMVDAEVSEPGQCLIAGHAFAGYLGAVKGDLVDVMSAGSLANVRVGRSRAEFHRMGQGQYPERPRATATAFATIEADELRDCLGRISAIPAPRFDSPEAIDRPWAASFLLSTQATTTLVMQACTPYAAGEVALGIGELLLGLEGAIVVPATALLGALREMKGDVSLAVDESTFVVRDDTRSAVLRILDESKVPNVTSVLAAKPAAEFTVNLDELRGAVRLAAMSSDQLALEVTPGSVRVLTHTPTKGELVVDSESVIDADTEAAGLIYASADFLGRVLAGLSDDPTFNFDPDKVGRVAVTDHRARYVFAAVRKL